MQKIITDRKFIKEQSVLNEEENDAFRSFLQQKNNADLDESVHYLNEVITPQIDCTACGGCCNQLMINITPEETLIIADHLKMPPQEFRERFVEESLHGKMVINSIPCHFLKEKKCTVYKNRFSECREFPHLHKPNFKGRLFSTLIHYAMCPIIYNVVEELKVETGFKNG